MSAQTDAKFPKMVQTGVEWLDANVPRGMAGATAQSIAQAPTVADIRQGALTVEGEEQLEQFQSVDSPAAFHRKDSDLSRKESINGLHLTPSGQYPNGYRFPPKHTRREALAIGCRASIRFPFKSIFNFLLVVYGLNVVAWGGMIFLLLCGAGDKYMCPGEWRNDCSSKHAPKSAWIEIDAQILTALFCVTAFGLAPFRLIDCVHLVQFRVRGNYLALRKLAAIHRGWFRLPDSQQLDPLIKCPPMDDIEAQKLVPFPPEKGPEVPLTGHRAPPVALWKMDFVVWMMWINTVVQIPLCGVMWGMNRFTRPAWVTALLIVFGMVSALAAGILQLIEGRKIKAREGVPWRVSKR